MKFSGKRLSMGRLNVLKRVFAMVLLLSFMAGSNVVAYAAETELAVVVDEVSLLEAENVAVSHIKSIMVMNEDSPWNNGVKIKNRKALFDENEEITAYYFGLVNRNNEPSGYVITSATTAGYPLLEYAEEGESFINRSIENTSNQVVTKYNKQVKEKHSKVYYFGGISYAVEHTLNDDTRVMYDVTTAQTYEINKEEIRKAKKSKNKDAYRTDYRELWSCYDESDYSGSSNPPNSQGDGYIFTPSDYECNYSYQDSYTIYKGVNKYSMMDDFSDGKVCSPTAAINLCRYWYRIDSEKYGSLRINGSWEDSFWEMYECFNTSKEDGTYDYGVADGYMLYFDQCGLSCKAYFSDWTDNGRNILGELKNDRPVHVNVHEHYKYKDHAVLAVGYWEFIYSHWYGNTYSTYIKIVDGHYAYPNRYIWGGTYGDWNYIVVIPD